MAPSRLASNVGRVIADRYRITAPLGAGASAEVYLATDVRLDREVAVKILQPALAADNQFLERFRTEAKTVAGISHPNVVVVHDWGEAEVPYLVTEYLAGGSLRAMLSAGHRLSQSQALVIGLDVCRGLTHAHGLGLVHRDLKPANLLFDPEGRLRIADFGLARAIAEASVTEELGAMVGTARYAAPEQARGMRVDGKADVYSLATLLVEAVTGAVPFAADTTVATLMARTTRDLPVPDDLGPLRGVLERAGRLDPESRPDAEELGLALLAASEQLTAPAALPLVGALTEAESAPEPSEMTQTLQVASPDGSAPDQTRAADAAATAAAPTVEAGAPPVAGDPGPPAAEAVDLEPPSAGERKRRRWPLVVGALLLLAIGAGAFFAWDAFRTRTHSVPEVAGQQLSDLQLIAEQNDWEIDEKRVRENGTEFGEIVSTDPAAGERLAEGGTLVVFVSEGWQLTDMPTGIAGEPLADVEAAFEDAGLRLVVVEEHDEEVPEGAVIGFVDEEPPERLAQNTEVEVAVSLGPAPRTVPALDDDMAFEDYAARLAEVQLGVDRKNEFSSSVPEGGVIAVGTDPGTEVPRDTAIEVVVSRGPRLVAVPDVIGMNRREARDALEEVGLELGGTNRNQGIVVATNPEVGEEVRPGTEVDLLLRRN